MESNKLAVVILALSVSIIFVGCSDSSSNINSVERTIAPVTKETDVVEDKESLDEVKEETTLDSKEVYEYMMGEFNSITNNGENYNPEVHDLMVIQRASKHFNITEAVADKIFLEEATKGF